MGMSAAIDTSTRSRIEMLQRALHVIVMESKKLEAALRRDGMRLGDALPFMLDRIETDANDLGRILKDGSHQT
jgi:hypothetical protein